MPCLRETAGTDLEKDLYRKRFKTRSPEEPLREDERKA
jgi:hypothetical protein